MARDPGGPTLVSRFGLNAVNFFLAEVVGVVLPFLADLLRSRGWRYDAIGVAASAAGLGVLVAQTPAGLLLDRVRRRRLWLAASSLLLGAAFGLVPLVARSHVTTLALLFLGGTAQSLFVPALGALAVALVGHVAMHRTMAVNQAYNHAGNLASALSAIVLVGWLGVGSVFGAVFVVSVLAAASCLLIRPRDLRHEVDGAREDRPPLAVLAGDRDVVVLLASVALFHLANAPAMPLVALEVKALHGTDTQVADVVLVAQCVMVPIAWACGPLAGRLGRKPVFAAGFLVLPLRLLTYAFAHSPWALVALQSLDGVGAGVYGVLVAATCSDLARRHGGFNTLMGIAATAQALGGVVGPVVSGVLVQHLGFAAAFALLAAVAASAAALYVGAMPETGELPPWRAGIRGTKPSPA